MRSYSSESAGRGLDTITGKAIILSYLHFSGCNLVTEETIKIKFEPHTAKHLLAWEYKIACLRF